MRIHFDSSAAQTSNGLPRGTVVIDDLKTHDKIFDTALLVRNSTDRRRLRRQKQRRQSLPVVERKRVGRSELSSHDCDFDGPCYDYRINCDCSFPWRPRLDPSFQSEARGARKPRRTEDSACLLASFLSWQAASGDAA